MGVARLVKVTVISPRSEYEEVAKSLAEFEDFHRIGGAGSGFDPQVQELTVKAVRLFAQADQAVKDLDIPLMPGQMDIVFRGVRVPETRFDAGSWDELLEKAEGQLAPIAEEVKAKKTLLQKAQKEETDAENTMAALKALAGFASDLGGMTELRLVKAVAVVVESERLDELRKSIPESMFFSQSISDERSVALVAVRKADEAKLDRALKLLELKPLVLPQGMPQNPAKAYWQAAKDHDAASAEREKIESEMAEVREKQGQTLLAVRELTEISRKALDDLRVSGEMKRIAAVSGYIPAKEEPKLREMFGRWMVYTEAADPEGKEPVPTLLEGKRGLSLFEPITREQGIPGIGEVDPTPIVTFVFPIFFGMMFGDVGHGIILTLFALLVRERGTPRMRQWGNIFIAAGLSSIFFGTIFGEFFELSLYKFVPIPPVIEIIDRMAIPNTFNIQGVYLVMEIAILIGVAHLTTALSLDVYQGTKEHNRLELLLEKVPTLTMYVSGVGYGLAFIGAGYNFDVLKSSAPAPLIGVPNDVLGAVSLAVLIPSMLVLLAGRSVAIAAGKMSGDSPLSALSNGGLEVFERISQFLSNTVSYVRLAVMLLVHAALLLITNQYFGPWINPAYIVPWVILNLMIVAFEAFIVYVQDLRLHLYEFFTKFYLGTGTPFRRIVPESVRAKINWH